ncbi:prefoldin subunit 4, putative [Plasmodium ovale wallikeri]|uniref:Prefoldin subunit 4, putative n=1 Tax=Plasmodium ovale wallikeri TaxID=864142 RepID=A0A1A8YNZ5_PLAOA|nr:prefoldin subunit 4, putative [Plasmodium ovale wallikeri]SBT33627.1 prefoldin subunit 4, putative [Plasmodium ovale wallikeri]
MANIRDAKYDLGLDMTVDDQKKIGKFTNLHYKQSLYEQKIKMLKESISNIDSSIDEASLVFDPNDVMLGIGTCLPRNSCAQEHVPVGEEHTIKQLSPFYAPSDCFFSVDTEYVEESLEQARNEEIKNLSKLELEYKNLVSEKKKLKTELYAKFGNRIDLN